MHLPNLTHTQLQALNVPFTDSEINKAIDSLPNNKFPGPDGFVGEYYKQFKSILGEHLVRLFNEATSLASFPLEMLTAMIITWLKPGKESTAPQNFHPISLLNHDMKLPKSLWTDWLTFSRLLYILTSRTSWKGARPLTIYTGWWILSTMKKAVECLLCFYFWMQRRHSVHWQYLSMVLKKFSFHGHIFSAIMALYSCPTAQVYCSSMLSKPFYD